MSKLRDYKYMGARALVLLHENCLREFLETWRLAKSSGVTLPETSDSDYRSFETLLRHVLGCARSYMVWMCEKLELPDPEIETVPAEETIEAESESYIEHVLARWRNPLAHLPEEAFYEPSYLAKWQVEYCIDAMLEHAVMHPVRHSFQLRELTGEE
ncbi:MAG: hypothetical protein AMJ46_11975 [Latescibacteria bacterium DG_63]|nr:MAG: hypothetical protein AMJ46_11975 [Latescibacteria bacterium DG_63]